MLSSDSKGVASSGIQFRPRNAAPSSAGPTSVLRVEGMDCGNCARSVSEALQSVSGVAFAAVDLKAATARVQWKAGEAPNADTLIEHVRKAGYRATIAKPESTDQDHVHDHGEGNPWKRALVIGIPATVVLLTADWILGLSMNRAFQWFAFTIGTFVQIAVGWKFYVGAWRQLRAGRSNMDTLVSLGSTAAYGFSAWSLFTGRTGHLFFAEAVTILTLISVGHWMEARMSERAGDALRSLLNLAPPNARVIEANGMERDVPVADLAVGRRILIKPGDRVPVDAEVSEGESSVDESMLTGEPLPVRKTAGAKLFAGTTNAEGRLVAVVRATGTSTVLSQIAEAVQRAQSSRASVQRLADQVSSVFVPVVIILAIGTAFWWGTSYEAALRTHAWLGNFLWHAHVPETPLVASVMAFCAVLIVACPCAMGLATPVALMAGINVAARRGILIRDAIALEKSGNISAVAFDKTGTLTWGRPELASCISLRPETSNDGGELATAAALAAPSNHPLSRAIAEAGRSADASGGSRPTLHGWREIPGNGIEARVGSADLPAVLRLGSSRWMKSLGIDTAEAERQMGDSVAAGKSLVILSENSTAVGVLVIGDAIRPDTAGIIVNLSGRNRSVHLVSGDARAACLAVAKTVGIPEQQVFAECSPEQKTAVIASLQKEGRRVAFVGDGINDSPALASADLGIAVAKAADIAREAADIVLLRPGLASVADALDISERTLRTIRQNLFWAFFYNAAAIPLAATGFMSPVLCALTMGLSDVVVIGNALRLRAKR